MEKSAQIGDLFRNQPIDPTVMIYALIGMAVIIGLIMYMTYRYQRYKKFVEFREEMATLELASDEETVLSDMVKRFSMQEPVQILLSKRVFDELAAQEINRILGSPGSVKAKEAFINLVYEIRKKTYQKDWSEPSTIGVVAEKQEAV